MQNANTFDDRTELGFIGNLQLTTKKGKGRALTQLFERTTNVEQLSQYN
jgi:hypothetical protein